MSVRNTNTTHYVVAYDNVVSFLVKYIHRNSSGAKFEMSDKRDTAKWSKYAENYDPIKVGSIDGKPFDLLPNNDY